jgi:hypothetical protein
MAVNEVNILNENARNLISVITPSIEYIEEKKEFPVQFDDDGNLLIKSINKIDFEQEYSKSHKLLLSYEKSDNIEGIKFELARLWFLNQVLEQRLHDAKFKSSKDKYNKARARILNDFKKYLDLVVEKEQFNFAEYYDSTPFSNATYKINKSTLKYTGEFLKKLIL